jgi:hypothetical protein
MDAMKQYAKTGISSAETSEDEKNQYRGMLYAVGLLEMEL